MPTDDTPCKALANLLLRAAASLSDDRPDLDGCATVMRTAAESILIMDEAIEEAALTIDRLGRANDMLRTAPKIPPREPLAERLRRAAGNLAASHPHLAAYAELMGEAAVAIDEAADLLTSALRSDTVRAAASRRLIDAVLDLPAGIHGRSNRQSMLMRAVRQMEDALRDDGGKE
jgi:hypothetical protein